MPVDRDHCSHYSTNPYLDGKRGDIAGIICAIDLPLPLIIRMTLLTDALTAGECRVARRALSPRILLLARHQVYGHAHVACHCLSLASASQSACVYSIRNENGIRNAY